MELLKSIAVTILDWIGALLSNELFIAVVAALAAYLFALRSQKKLLQEQQKLDVYKTIWEKRDDFMEATITLSAQVKGLGTEFVMLKSIDDTRNTMRGIVEKQDFEYDYDMRQRWNAYCMRIGENGSAVSQSFGKMHSSFEQTFFMYPHLEKAFFLLRDEYQHFFVLHQELIQLLYSFDGATLIEKSNQDLLLKQVDERGLAEKLIELQVYSDDYFKLVQHALTGKVFQYNLKERVPFVGKILTPEGWKHIQKTSEDKFDAKMIKQAEKEAQKSSEPLKCGVVLVDGDNQIVAKTFNSQRKDNRTANHAEMNAIKVANEKVGRKLTGFTAYCSCEPCTMCLTALIFASVDRIVYAQPLNELVAKDKQIYVDSFNFVSRFPNPPRLEWFNAKSD